MSKGISYLKQRLDTIETNVINENKQIDENSNLRDIAIITSLTTKIEDIKHKLNNITIESKRIDEKLVFGDDALNFNLSTTIHQLNQFKINITNEIKDVFERFYKSYTSLSAEIEDVRDKLDQLVEDSALVFYSIHSQLKTWPEARQFCINMNRRLAVIETRAEEAALMKMVIFFSTKARAHGTSVHGRIWLKLATPSSQIL